MNVLLLCSQGMSTGMLCDRIAAAAKEDGSMDKFVAEANTLAEGNTYEGLLDNQG